MTRKTATLWKQNPSKNADAAVYSSAAVVYNSTATAYTSSTSNTDEFAKIASSWNRGSKTATPWSPNAAANASLYPYDSASKVYDLAADTYDGIVSGQDFGDQETATAWAEAS